MIRRIFVAALLVLTLSFAALPGCLKIEDDGNSNDAQVEMESGGTEVEVNK